MHRNLKLGLYGLVLAGLLGGTASWVTATGKTVNLRVDGQVRQVHTDAADVHGVLQAAHIAVGEHDLVAPDESAAVADGDSVVVRRGHLLHLLVNGAARDVWVNADSVDEALNQLGYGTQNLVSVSRSKRLDGSVTSLSVTSPKQVTFRADGKTLRVLTFGPTLKEALEQAHLKLGAHDVVSAKLTSAVRDRQVVTIQRVTYKYSVVRQGVPFDVVRQDDPNRAAGSSAVLSAGRDGVRQVTYQLRFVDGKLAGRVVYDNRVVQSPVPQRTAVGTQQSGPVPAGTAQQIAADMVAARGWGGDQFSCLVSLWNKESGWRTNAANPSGAYGIPQALPGSKMASAGADWQTSARTQISWGLGYIASVYGTPCSAWAHSQATNWY
ncbi:ubiquitin-like domain-containing protein [Jatrophihabitans sp.]|uniref:aggregation-promoting factor C-terminal-like domain-containing protein n=1 Tax=Jatrophihabitans sp. TaxID=1932789 RepID=UPI002BC673E3|nr:ubiquitin-like domain-containing protein [Jatrophihabitans sp.]